ncbi:MAG: GTPase, partial [candidate division WOR-3 bacterium]
ELLYHPGEANLRLADVVVINKITTAKVEWIATVQQNIVQVNPTAQVVKANSPITVEEPEKVRGKRVLVVEDGPTLTHGEMSYGAGTLAAEHAGAAQVVDPRPFAVGSIKKTFEKYPHIGSLLPAMGYSPKQLKELEKTINATDCDLVLIGTPIDLRRVIKIEKPAQRVFYELADHGSPTLEEIIRKRFA